MTIDDGNETRREVTSNGNLGCPEKTFQTFCVCRPQSELLVNVVFSETVEVVKCTTESPGHVSKTTAGVNWFPDTSCTQYNGEGEDTINRPLRLSYKV